MNKHGAYEKVPVAELDPLVNSQDYCMDQAIENAKNIPIRDEINDPNKNKETQIKKSPWQGFLDFFANIFSSKDK